MISNAYFVDPVNGSDTPGSGITPGFKTVSYAVTQLTTDYYRIGLKGGYTEIVRIDLNSFANTSSNLIKEILSVDSSGDVKVDGVWTISGGGTVDYALECGSASYPWKLYGLKFDNYTEYLINPIANYWYYPMIEVVEISNMKGFVGTTLGTQLGLFRDVKFTNLSGGAPFLFRGSFAKNLVFENCAASGSNALIQPLLTSVIDGLIVVSSSWGYNLIYAGTQAYVKNAIISGSVAGYLVQANIFNMAGECVLENIVLRNLSISGSPTSKNIVTTATYSPLIRNLKYYNCVGFDKYDVGTGSLRAYGFDELTEDPCNDDLTFKYSYPYKRYQMEMGGHNGYMSELA